MITIRKKDSATSLLLFIYNNYLTHFDKNTLKLTSIINIMKSFGKSESATRMALSRTVKSNILTKRINNREVYYSLDKKGKDSINLWNENMESFWKRYNLRNNKWNNKWHLINLEFSESEKEKKLLIIERFKKAGFGLINSNTLISPYYQSIEINKILSEITIINQIIQINGDLKVDTGIEILLEKTFKIGKISTAYKDFLNKYEKKYIEINNINENRFLHQEEFLPLLHSLGWDFYSIATLDVALPKEICSSTCINDKAIKFMINFRKLLLKDTIKYLEKFD